MNVNRNGIILVSLGVIVSAGLFLVTRGTTPTKALPSPAQTVAVDPVPSKLEEQRQHKVQAIRQALTAPKANAPTPRPEFLKVLPDIWSLHLSINRAQTYRDLAADMSQNPRMIDEIKSVLLDLEKTRDTYGDLQAQARVVAVDLLGELARQEQPEPLLQVLTTLNQAHLADTAYDSRQDVDRLDLLRTYISVQGPKLLEDLPDFLTRTAFSPALAEEYDNLLWVWLKNTTDKEQLRNRLAYFNQYIKNSGQDKQDEG
jgi:hypothetical protein